MKHAVGLVLLLGVLWLGCGGGADGDQQFSQQHAAEIRKDCNETINCLLQRDEQVPEDPFNGCISASGKYLEGGQSRQMTFLNNYARCSQFIFCDYLDCAQSGATGYSEAQAPHIQQRCQAESDCRAFSGTPDADPAGAITSCIYVKSGELEAAIQTMRSAWETAFLRCMALTGCDFVNCYQMTGAP